MVLHLILASKLSELERFEVFWDPTFFWLTLYKVYVSYFIVINVSHYLFPQGPSGGQPQPQPAVWPEP